MKVKSLVAIFALFLVFSTLAFAQSKETGAIVGTIYDEEKNPLHGVAITLQSPSLMGLRKAITVSDGSFRFPALPPGTYTLKAELQGFKTVVQENIRLSTAIKLTVDLTMEVAGLKEEVTVVAEAPTVDLKSSETVSVALSNELLRNVPYNNFATDIVNLAPGVQDYVAYGASQRTGIAWQVDGVDVSDPEAGSAWIFLDPHIVEEAKIMGIGASAEYGNFTGAIFNLVTKSGGNEFSGHFETDFQGKKGDWPEKLLGFSLWGVNNNEAYKEDFPEITAPAQKLYELGAHIGGPIKKDKVWFYLGGHFFRRMDYVTGFPEAVDYKMPRAFAKITFQLTPRTNIMTFFEYDAYNGVNRDADATHAEESCLNQKSPDYVGNFSLTHILSSRTFFDLKAAFFTGYYYLDPEAGDVSGHFNINDNMLYESAGYFLYCDRTRYQANASLTHYAEDFIKGNHDFKFGVEFEYGKVRNRFGYTGPNHRYYVDYVGYSYYGGYYTGNYIAYQYEGYDTNTRYLRVEEFAQDSWKISNRLNLNFGVRLSHMWGGIKGRKRAVYNNFRIAPRLGFTFDIFGNKKTVFKAHYGQFTEAMLSSYHDRLNPSSAYHDYIVYRWDLGLNDWAEDYSIVHEDLYSIDPNIKHPYLDQFTASIERELLKDASFSISYIYRNWRSIIGYYDTLAQFEETTVDDPETGAPITVYNQTNPGEDKFIITNIKKGDPGILLNPYRRYWGIEFLFNKRFSSRWQLLASYVYSQTKGTIDNGFAYDIGYANEKYRSEFDPNYWINVDGHATNDPTHMIKVQGTYQLSSGIFLTAYFRAITGDTWTRTYWISLDQGFFDIYTERHGSHRYPMQKILDLRLEKTFTLAKKYRLGVMVDIFNLFNDDSITDWGTKIDYDWLPGEWPSTDGHQLYEIVRPRQLRLGLRLIF